MKVVMGAKKGCKTAMALALGCTTAFLGWGLGRPPPMIKSWFARWQTNPSLKKRPKPPFHFKKTFRYSLPMAWAWKPHLIDPKMEK